MRALALTGTVAVALALTLSACSTSGDMNKPEQSSTSQGQDQMNDSGGGSDMMKEMSGAFSGLNGKNVAGTATVKDGKLVLSGFSSDEGPDLHVYLTKGTDEAAVMAGKMIDKVSFDTADQTFDLSGLDTSMYTDVVIHCDKAKAVFGAAMLS